MIDGGSGFCARGVVVRLVVLFGWGKEVGLLTPLSSSVCTMTKLSCAGFRVLEFVILAVPFCCGVCGLCKLVGETETSAFIACEMALGVSGDLDIVSTERDRVCMTGESSYSFWDSTVMRSSSWRFVTASLCV